MSNAKYIITIVIVGAVLIIGAVMLGRSDNGEINVNEAINNANQANSENGNTGEAVSTVREDLRDLPNGGLVPQNPEATPPTPEPELESDLETDTGEEDSSDEPNENEEPENNEPDSDLETTPETEG